MKITEKRIIRDYNRLKSLICDEAKAQHWNNVCNYIRRAAVFMYNCNVIYSDLQLEDVIAKMSNACIDKSFFYIKRNLNTTTRRVVFYDYFSLDNRGLTEQYIDAFKRLNIPVLFIMRNKESDTSHEIYKKIKCQDNFSIYVTEEHQGEKLIQEIFKVTIQYNPTDLLVHTAPWDVEGLSSFYAMKGVCTRFLSNITDHAYWLGTTIFDYFIEFRDYGCNISQTYRGICPERDIKMPYFPIINKDIKFEGFPFDIKNKKLIVSGGSIYKIKGNPKYLEIVKHILDHHSDAVFLYLGSGDHRYLQDFSDRNGYGGRFYHLPERKDIYQIISRSTLYLNTYPKLGGLMTQIAAMAGKLPLTLNDENDHFQSISEFLCINKFDTQLEYHDMDGLKRVIDNYLNKPTLLCQAEKNVKSTVLTPERFAKMMRDVFENHDTGMEYISYSINTNQFANSYIKQLNNNQQHYWEFFYSHDFKLFWRFVPYYLKVLLNKKKWLLR